MRAVTYQVETNAVLRNTFFLLSLMLLPTLGGVWAGEAWGLNALLNAHPILGFIAALGVMMFSLFLVNATRESALGVVFALVFAGVMGLVLSGAVEYTLSLKHGTKILMEAVGGTIACTVGCSLYAMTTKRDFSNWGAYLVGFLLALIVLMVLNLFFMLPWLSVALSTVALFIFSAFLIYDVQQIVNGGETNYVMAAISVFLDVANLFVNLLNLLSAFNDD